MSAAASGVEVVDEFLRPLMAEGESEMRYLLDDPAHLERIHRLIAPGAPTTFEDPNGAGAMSDLAGPWIGPEGFIAGWREWLKLWSEFRFDAPRRIDAGGGRVVLLVGCEATMRGTDVTVKQPAGALYTIRDGQIQEVRHFLDQKQARQAAGLE